MSSSQCSDNNNLSVKLSHADVTEILENAPQLTVGVLPKLDRAIHGNSEALEELCNGDFDWLPSPTEFHKTQYFISEYLRGQEVRWLANLCSTSHCDLIVFPLTVSYLDRYMCKKVIKYDTLRYISCACFFIACKLKMAKPPRYDILKYTYPVISTRALSQYEIDVADVLGWEFNTPTPYEYYDQLLAMDNTLVIFQADFADALYELFTDLRLACIPPKLQALRALTNVVSIEKVQGPSFQSWNHFFEACMNNQFVQDSDEESPNVTVGWSKME